MTTPVPMRQPGAIEAATDTALRLLLGQQQVIVQVLIGLVAGIKGFVVSPRFGLVNHFKTLAFILLTSYNGDVSVHANSGNQCNRSTTNCAIFNIFLMLYTTVNNYLDMLTTVRTINPSRVNCIHKQLNRKSSS